MAALARLKFSDEERKNFGGQFSRILEYVEKIKSVDVGNVTPLVHTYEQDNIFRPDENTPSLPREQVLANAPAKENGFFKVPRVIE